MKVFDWKEFSGGAFLDFAAGQRSALTVGVFDGLHRGHAALLQAIRERNELIPLVITCRRNPKEFLKKSAFTGDILSLSRKLELFDEAGAAAAVLIDFSARFSTMAGKDFLTLLLKWGNPAYAAVGSNFHCGHRMDTGAAETRAFFAASGVHVTVVESVRRGEDRVSSSRIRAAIRAGNVAQAAEMLGRPVEIDLPVGTRHYDGREYVRFRMRGRVLPPGGTWPVLVRRNGLPPARAEARIADGEIALFFDAGVGVKNGRAVVPGGMIGNDTPDTVWRVEFSGPEDDTGGNCVPQGE
ncbi:MAG: FAD synthetase family protein [Spirochaetaceae bacterium]|nr:FAD synthetase family protein [Spirochaetaceae bacterium]